MCISVSIHVHTWSGNMVGRGIISFFSTETLFQSPSQGGEGKEKMTERGKERGVGGRVPWLNIGASLNTPVFSTSPHIYYSLWQISSSPESIWFSISEGNLLPPIEVRVGKLFGWVGAERDSSRSSSFSCSLLPGLPVCSAMCAPFFRGPYLSTSWVPNQIVTFWLPLLKVLFLFF